MEGLIHAYAVTHDEELRPVIDELIGVFLRIDLLSIKAQTHATLTALRGLLRYAALTGDRRYISEAASRFLLYTQYGMTENFANYNWFCRYDTWTEPCAIVDSYLLAVQLWQQTRDVAYLQWAEQIYFNALCRGQRHNGGFGCDNCPGKGSGTPALKVSTPEAHWCCTMRGAEGLSNAARYSMFQHADTLFFPFYRPAAFKASIRKQQVGITEHTQYPLMAVSVFPLLFRGHFVLPYAYHAMNGWKISVYKSMVKRYLQRNARVFSYFVVSSVCLIR
jgi:hypothetical protein